MFLVKHLHPNNKLNKPQTHRVVFKVTALKGHFTQKVQKNWQIISVAEVKGLKSQFINIDS